MSVHGPEQALPALAFNVVERPHHSDVRAQRADEREEASQNGPIMFRRRSVSANVAAAAAAAATQELARASTRVVPSQTVGRRFRRILDSSYGSTAVVATCFSPPAGMTGRLRRKR